METLPYFLLSISRGQGATLAHPSFLELILMDVRVNISIDKFQGSPCRILLTVRVTRGDGTRKYRKGIIIYKCVAMETDG